MPVTYRRCDSDTIITIHDVMRKYHGAMADAEVTIQCLMAYPPQDENGDATGPALMLHGHPCAATIRQTNLKQRAAGMADLEIILDNDQWSIASRKEQQAIIDHKLTHFILKTDKDGGVLRDDLDRPKLEKVEYDRQYGWFFAVARRHGEHSIKVRQYRELLDSQGYVQSFLPVMEPEEVEA